MHQIVVEHPYTMDDESLKELLHSLLEKLSIRDGIDSTWVSDGQLDVSYKGAKGSIVFGNQLCTVSVSLTFLLRFFSPSIKGDIHKYLETHLY